MARITFQLPGGASHNDVWIYVHGQPKLHIPAGADWTAPAQLPGSHVTFVAREGHWDMALPVTTVTAPGKHLLAFAALPHGGPLGWWHAAHRVGAGGIARGAGMRIGVIDEALEIQQPGSCIAHVVNDGGAAWGSVTDPRALNPQTKHGQAVSALIASRASNSTGYAGVAPGAEVFFAAAGSPTSERLDVQRVEDCIAHLSESRKCHILSISAGDLEDPSPALQRAVDVAAQFGTLCFFAAGNEGVPKWPARYGTCLAVAALGQVGHAAAGSAVELIDRVENQPLPKGTPPADTYYMWTQSANGPEIDFCAPGVGIIWSRAHMSARAQFGTSFACPLAAATAALILQNDAPYSGMKPDRQRYDYAIKRLKLAANPLGRAGRYWKYGLLQL